MKITNCAAFKNWCDQAPKVRERIDFDNLPDAQKDQAVIAYCMDFNSRHMRAMALHLQSATCSQNVKESAFRNSEYAIHDLVRQYNDMLDLRDAKLADNSEADEFAIKEQHINKAYRHDKPMTDVCHKPSDFA
jgi:uncharacterized protein YfaS (alpha-2-macroglobulin family)